MNNDTPLAILWRRKWIVVVTFLVFVVTTAILSKTLEKVYSTDSTLIVSLPAESQSFDTVQAGQAVARSYADIIDSPNVAQLVANRFNDGTSKSDLLGATSFEPISETQLLRITAEDPNPARAKRIADVFADVFVDYARERLRDITRADVSIADAAPLPTQPARPKPTLYTLLASLIGLALGLALAFLRDRLDRRLRTAEDVEARFDATVLARVPVRGRTEASLSAFHESYRILRTNLDFAAGGRPLRSIAVVSGGEGEGKTTMVAHIAIASAEVGLRVLAVEADLRRPGLERVLDPDRTEPRQPGFSNYLVESASVEEVIYSTHLANVDVVPAGPLPPSPSALLDSRQGRAAVPEFLEYVDLVVIDCPPLSIGADASVLSGLVDGVIVAVDLERSRDDTVRDALRQLEAVQAPVMGIVLNRDRAAEVSRYDYYYYNETQAAKADGDGQSALDRLRERVQ